MCNKASQLPQAQLQKWKAAALVGQQWVSLEEAQEDNRVAVVDEVEQIPLGMAAAVALAVC